MLKRIDFILNEKMFDFDRYPELEKLYEKFHRLSSKFRRLCNRDNQDVTELLNEVQKLELGELSKKVFDTFHGKVEYVVYDETEKKSWAEMFGDDWEKLDENHKKCLTWLLDGEFIYCLPDEYYVSPLEFFDRKGRNEH